MISPVGIIFKGSGFYSTDHKSPSGAPPTSSAKKDDKKPDKKVESKAAVETKDTKPAEKTKS